MLITVLFLWCLLFLFNKTWATQKKCETTRNNPKFPNWGNLKFSACFRFSNFEPNALIWAFWAKTFKLSNLSTKFCLYSISQVLLLNMTLVFENFESEYPQIWAFWAKKYQLSIFNKILYVSPFGGADFKPDICFWKSRVQILKFGHFEPKCIYFLILRKFVYALFRRCWF